MKQYSRANGIATLNNSDSNSFLSVLGAGITLMALTTALLFSSGVFAADHAMSKQNKVVMNSEKDVSKARVNISHSEMTSETKKSMPKKDVQIGAFSMEDGAREGFYGDGAYGD